MTKTTATVVGYAVYSDLNFSCHEGDRKTRRNALRFAASLRCQGFNTTIRAYVVCSDGRSWCETVEQVRAS